MSHQDGPLTPLFPSLKKVIRHLLQNRFVGPGTGTPQSGQELILFLVVIIVIFIYYLRTDS